MADSVENDEGVSVFLVRLIYVSQATAQFRPDQIENMLMGARQSNAEKEVTGALFFSRKYFVQCLEGSRSAVNEIYLKILNDGRHSNAVLLQYQEIDRREFSDWSMAYLPESSKLAPLIKTYSRSAIFEPYNMTGESCHQLLIALRVAMS